MTNGGKRRRGVGGTGFGLPIHKVSREIIRAVAANESVVLVGDTGSGKSTQLPQILADSRKFGVFPGSAICITQPRRVAAVTIAQRVAYERGKKVGTEVGYAVRFEDVTSKETSIKYATEGILLRESLSDGLLSRYSTVILDEAHERTLDFDILLGLLKSVQAKRRMHSSKGAEANGRRKLKPLKLIIMSATLEADVFCKYLDCPKLDIPGRKFPVERFYTITPETDYVEAAVCATFQLHSQEPEGDILLFLTGQDQIETVEGLVSEHVRNMPQDSQPLSIVMLYAAMPPEQQMKAFEPAPKGTRKLILATNIAETSLTIDGVRYVIDPGVVKQRRYNPMTCSDSLTVVPISRAQVKQRAGRAGRQGPGKAFHLFPESEFFKLSPTSIPEVKRTNLANTVLQMKAMGIEDVMLFDFLEPPPKSALVRAFELLLSLGALNSSGNISPEGKQMCGLPVDPKLAKAILSSTKLDCLDEILKIVSLLSVESVLHMSKKKKDDAHQAHLKFLHDSGDMLTLLQILNNFKNVKGQERVKWSRQNFVNARPLTKACNIYTQLSTQVKHVTATVTEGGGSGDKVDDIMKCICTGYFSNAAQRMPDGTYQTLLSAQKVHIHPSSVLFKKKPDCIIFIELVQTTKLYARNVGLIEAAWLPELIPDIFVVS
ncbi:DEAH-box nuclear pre-mRNA splicing factor [Chloropicon primus]|uniref:RNA helicase n=1 Tax=Chloropicon primus TaxID=1764295 RepID=A0A5B8MB10_9CHLO|nr:DEAH-box nuclear pre-mRNA splicing factor [Chloropicon primus]UPQ96854.1 DEAH-box nuclear pre-mRNA splicing factor [Chloropicon primus]|eukprot:QDZ17638.1 DEAH-box nuclear pre-mRNA splicing factor [Chloropicon primus]